MPWAILALMLKYFEIWGVLDLSILDFLNTGEIYGGFTFVLGFTLVFRTSQSYTRYWAAATAIHEMGSEWSDSCASLLAFASCSKAPAEAVQRYMHLTVRLFSLLHAMAMEEVAELKDENFHVIDIMGIDWESLHCVQKRSGAMYAQGSDVPNVGHALKTNTVLCWLKKHIVIAQAQGIIAVPPPILTRVFHELSMGLVEYHKAQQVVIWPFPFPYAQLNTFLIWIYLAVSPLVISTWDTSPWIIAGFTLLTACSMVGLDCIAAEIEAPFGADQNDLPCFEMMDDYNNLLMAQLDPSSWKVPHLTEHALLDFRALTHPENLCRTCSVEERVQDTAGKPPSVPSTVPSDLVNTVPVLNQEKAADTTPEPQKDRQLSPTSAGDLLQELRELRRQQQDYFAQQSQQQKEFHDRHCALLQHLINAVGPGQRGPGTSGQWCGAPATAASKTMVH